MRGRGGRLMVLAVLALGGWLLSRASRGLGPVTGEAWGGVFSGGRLGPAALFLGAWVIVALAAGWLAVRRGVVGAYAALCGAMLVPAWRAGSLEAYLAHEPPPGAFRWLALEAAVYAVLLGAWALAVQHARARRAEALGVADARPVRTTRFASALGALLGAGIAAGLAFVLIREASPGQVMGGVALGCFVGTLVARVYVPEGSLVPVLVAPAVVSLLAYIPAVLWFGQGETVLTALFERNAALRLAAGLPSQYVAAGGLGVAWGAWVAAALDEDGSTLAAPAGPDRGAQPIAPPPSDPPPPHADPGPEPEPQAHGLADSRPSGEVV